MAMRQEAYTFFFWAKHKLRCLRPQLPSKRSNAMHKATKFFAFPWKFERAFKGTFCCCLPEVRCAASGDTLEKLLEAIQDLAAEYVEDCIENKLPLPEPQLKHPTMDTGFVQMAVIAIPVQKEKVI